MKVQCVALGVGGASNNLLEVKAVQELFEFSSQSAGGRVNVDVEVPESQYV